jgi:hypothetical protein
MNTNLFKSMAVAAVLASGLATTAAQAQIVQPGYVLQSLGIVNQQIRDEVLAAFEDGYTRVVADERGAMQNNGLPGTFRVRLERGVRYWFAGRCDEDCSDLDMVLKSAAGTELTADRDEDDAPSFTYRPTVTGDYVIQLELAGCNARRCQVGIVVMR